MGLMGTPWPWWAAALTVAAGLVWLANWYMDKPASDLDVYLTGIDDAISTGRSRLVTADELAYEAICDAVMEDAEVDWLERLYFEVPAAVK